MMGTRKKPIGLFDMDGTLFNYDEAMGAALKSMKAPEEPEYQGDFHSLEKYPHLNARIRMIRSVPGWWLKLTPIENGFKIYELAKGLGYDCQILTKGPRNHPLAWAEKLQCCQEHFGPDINVHIVQNKGIGYGKFLFDDFIPYIKQYLDSTSTGFAIMPVNESNKKWYHPRVLRWDGTNLDEVKAKLLEAMQ